MKPDATADDADEKLPDVPSDGWIEVKDNPYAIVHRGGWTIARYSGNGTWFYLLWHDREIMGCFGHHDEAKQRHVELKAGFGDTERGQR